MREDWSEYWAGKEKELTQTERLGLAYCRLNCWEWDDFIGEKPKDFDKCAYSSVKAKLFCPEIAGLFCRIAGLFCHDSRANLSLKPVCFGIAIS